MNVIDLFAGAGGLSEGFRGNDYNIIAHVEMDKNACLTLKTREIYYYLKKQNKLNVYYDYLKNLISRDDLYKKVPNSILNKVINEEITDNSIPIIFEYIDSLLSNRKVDLIIGGPPCQAYSLVGRSRDPKKMSNDPRNYLYKYYIQFLIRYEPKYFVFENVTGILSAKKGIILKEIQSEMEKAGYEIDYKILNSKDFGVLQSRKRVIIIGWRKEVNFTYPVIDTTKRYEKIIDLFEDLPKIKAGEKCPVGYHYLKPPNNYLLESDIRNKHHDILTQHISRPNRELDIEIYKYCVKIWNDERRKVKYNELPSRLITHKNTSTFLDRFKVVPFDEISHTIVAHISKDGHYYIHPDIEQGRSISIREAARIQSFPDNYFFEGSRTSIFKQIGNSVPPLMAKAISASFLR